MATPKRDPVDIFGALKADKRDDENWAAYADRIGVRLGNINHWRDRPPTGDLARLALWAMRKAG